MTYIRLLPLIAVAALLAGCGGVRRGAEAAVRENLKDPESARFGEFYYNAGLKRACVTVNAKNSMGGYTGDQQVSLQRVEKGWDYIESREVTQDACRESWADNPRVPS